MCGFLLSLAVAETGHAADMGLRISPELCIPFGNSVDVNGKQVEAYAVGGGMNLTAHLAIYGIFSPFLEAGVTYNKVNGSSTGLILGSGGAGFSFFYYPTARLVTRVGASAGFAAISVGSQSGYGAYWKTGAELGYRFTPGLNVLSGLSYAQYLGSDAPIYKGLGVSLTVDIGLGLLSDRGAGIVLEGEQANQIYPILYYKYAKEPITVITLTNREQVEIRDVRISYQAGAFTSRSMPCASFPVIQRGASVRFPIYAAFNEKVLSFTESTKVQSEVLVKYNILDSSTELSKAISIRFDDRNAITWKDPAMLAAYVAPNDPSMLEFSKFVAGLVRLSIRPEIDKNMQYALGLFEALRIYGLVWSKDPATPYASFHLDSSKTDYIQYPYQTLAYKSGDSDEIAVAYAEALESVAVPSAILPLSEDVLVAFPLEISEAEAKTSFSNLGDFAFQDGKAWVPLQASLMREGFLRAWQGGARLWREAQGASPSGKAAKLITISESWKTFSPITPPDVDFKPSKPGEEQVKLAFENALERYITREITPKVERMKAGMTGTGTGKQRNSLGILYAQYGLLDKARVEFQGAVETGYAPAVINLANVAFLLKDYETAARFFEAALKTSPNNKAALIGLARARYELDAFAEADDLFARAKAIDPALAERYAYLSSLVDSSSVRRASAAAADHGGGMTWDDE